MCNFMVHVGLGHRDWGVTPQTHAQAHVYKTIVFGRQNHL